MTPSPPHVRHGPSAAVPSGAAAGGEVPRGPESQKNHFSTCRVDGIPARQAGKPNLRHCRGRFLFPAICLQTLYSFPSCGILRKKNPFAEVRPARGRPGPAGKSGATPARSRRCMRRGLPSGVSQGPLPPCHCPPLGGREGGEDWREPESLLLCVSLFLRVETDGTGAAGISSAVPFSPRPFGARGLWSVPGNSLRRGGLNPEPVALSSPREEGRRAFLPAPPGWGTGFFCKKEKRYLKCSVRN